MNERPELEGIRRRYVRARRRERWLRQRGSLANEALLVVLEWGPPMRLPESWRLQQRWPEAGASERGAVLEAAHAVTHAAYELLTRAWPRDTREDPQEVDRASKDALQVLRATYPELEPDSLKRAVSQANYTHAK